MTYAYRNSGAWGAGNGVGAGGKLTSTQADNNIYQLASAIADLVAAGTAIGIDPDNPVTISGDQLTFHFSDSSIKTITVPTGMPVWRGAFAAVSYAAGDWFHSSGTIYRVLSAHSGELPFDSGAMTTASGDLYAKVLDFPSVPGFEIDDETFILTADYANSYIVLTNPSGSCAITIDPDATFADWTEISFRDETSAGTVTIEGSTAGAINPQFGCENQSAGIGSTWTIKKRGASNEWDIMGLLLASTA